MILGVFEINLKRQGVTLCYEWYYMTLQYVLCFYLKAVVLMSPNIDLTWVIDRSSSGWPNNHSDTTSDPARAGGASSQSSFSKLEIWMCVLAELVTNEFARGSCPHAVSHAWPIVFARLSALFQHVDPRYWNIMSFYWCAGLLILVTQWLILQMSFQDVLKKYCPFGQWSCCLSWSASCNLKFSKYT